MGMFKKKVKGTMKNPIFCKGCRFLKISGVGKQQVDVSAPPTGLTARCKAPARVQKKCEHWTTDLDEVERVFGMYDVASPEGMACVECVKFDGGKCPHAKLYGDDQRAWYAPRLDRNACLHFQHIKYIEGEAKVIE